MRVRRDVQSGAHSKRYRPEVIEEDEWTNHQALRRRECPANLEFVCKIAESWKDHPLNGEIRGGVRNSHYYISRASFCRRAALLSLTNSP
jgi:hypothetical protein